MNRKQGPKTDKKERETAKRRNAAPRCKKLTRVRCELTPLT